MHTQWPEMAADLAQDLSEALANVGGSVPAAAFDPSEVERIVAERASRQRRISIQAVERRLLTRSHPDWEGVVTSSDFAPWKQNVLKEEEATLDTSWDADFIGKKIDEFRSWKDKSQQSRTNKQKRLGRRSSRPVGRFPLQNSAKTTLSLPASSRRAVFGKWERHGNQSYALSSQRIGRLKGEILLTPSRSKFSASPACNARFRRTVATPWFIVAGCPMVARAAPSLAASIRRTAFLPTTPPLIARPRWPRRI